MTDQRDRSIEILLRQRHEDADAPSTDPCLDPELLAAWMENGLAADTRGAAEKHAAGCARCQALLASMARTAPDVDARPWWRSLTAKWLVPIAAVATGLAVWISVGRAPLPSTTTKPRSIAAARDVSRPDAAVTAPVAPPPATLPESAERRSAQLRSSGDARERQAFADSNRVKREGLAGGNEAVQQRSRPAAVGGVAGRPDAAARPQGQTAVDSLAPPSAASPVAPLPTPRASATANVRSAEAKPMTAKTLSEPVIVARDGVAKDVAGGTRNSFRGATFRALDIQSPNPNYRWRIVPPAGVQRSTDGGTTWAIVDPFPATTPLGAAVALSAGFSPSPETCWLVGRAGLVLLSTDGASWQRRAFPEQVDLTGVRASDAQRALVTTTDGRQFVTTDGGVTWVLVK